MSRRNRQSRGVILLVVLGILALFALVGVVYVITSGQHNTAVRNEIKGEQVGDPPDASLHSAMLQVLAGSRNKISALQNHSLLEDLYGNDAVWNGRLINGAAVVTSIPNVAPGPGGALQIDFPSTGVTAAVADDYNDYYTGCVFTITRGRQSNHSGLVVSYAQVNVGGTNFMRMRVMPFPGLSAQQSIDPSQVVVGDVFLINGRPFNGTGFGLSNVSVNNLQPLNLNDSNLLSDALDPWSRQQLGAAKAWPLALLPHPAFFRPADFTNPLDTAYKLNYLDPSGPGGADEDYDAADFQNWLLAARMSTAYGGQPRVVVAIPSFHRPELAQYWMARAINDFSLNVPNGTPITWDTLAPLGADAASQDAIRELARRSSLRPSALDHFNDRGNNGGIAGVRDPEEPDFAGKFPVGSTLGPAYDPVWPIDRDGDGVTDGAGWDVDNDGDGTPDSVWVDLGFPVQRRPDGTLYKPLFAFLVEDLDGKLNLNAHGTINHLAESAAQIGQAANMLTGNLRAITGPLAANAESPNPQTLLAPLGEGLGPAEVNLNVLTDALVKVGATTYRTGSESARPAASSPTSTQQGDLARLMLGAWNNSTKSLIAGRYGEPQFAPEATSGSFTYSLQTPRPFSGGSQSLRDLLMRLDATNYYFLAPPLTRTAWGYSALPPDLDGDGVIALDLRGQPFFSLFSVQNGSGEQGESFNNPYDFDLSRLTPPADGLHGSTLEANDAPFTAAEFERLLRFSDIDSQSLPDRLLALAPNLFAYDPLETNSSLTAYRRNLVTFASFDLPSPSVLPPVEAAWDDPNSPNDKSVFDNTKINDPGATRITDLVRARILEDNGSATTQLVNNSLPILLSYDTRANLKFDLNSPFGDGRDNQLPAWGANGVVDEAEEAMPPNGGTAQPAWPSSPAPSLTSTSDANNDGVIDGFDREPGARGAYARHLFVMATLMADKRFKAHDPPLVPPQQQNLETARRAAQWAVNAVDYRDRDAIMTYFEVDLRPFHVDVAGNTSTWEVDGDPATDESASGVPRAVFWGLERPELLITETLATHDRRVEDTNRDPSGKTTYETNPPVDDDLDQVRPPEGSLWIELYNPWRTITGDNVSGAGLVNRDLPAELYQNSAGGLFLDLAALSQEQTGGATTRPASSPVWRMAIQEDDTGNGDFRDPDDDLDSDANDKLTRLIYFFGNPIGKFIPPAPAYTQTVFRVDPGVTGTGDISCPVSPGRYFVLGPPGTPGFPSRRAGTGVARSEPPLATIIGKRIDFDNAQGTGRPGDPNWNSYLKSRCIEFVPNLNSFNAPNQVLVYGWDNATQKATPNYPQPWPTNDWPAQNRPDIEPPVARSFSAGPNRRLSVSEPLLGYPPANQLTTHSYSQPYDAPLDDGRGAMFDAAVPNGVQEGFFMVHLQRLANPLRLWHPQRNPYITIDSMPIDVCFFNGEHATTPPGGQNSRGISNSSYVENDVQIISRQRGDSVRNPQIATSTSAAKGLAFWMQEPPKRVGPSPLEKTRDTADTANVYKFPLGHSLGYVNFDWDTNNTTDGPTNWIRPGIDTTNSYAQFNSAANVDYTGVRKNPTPWLGFPNRPFVSANELLDVPATRASRLLNPGTFKRLPISPSSDAPAGHRSAATPDDYAGDPWNHIKDLETPNAPGDRLDVSTWSKGPSFPHLLNFFQTKFDATGGGGIPAYDNSTGKAPQWYRLLDYVHVPSRFIGAETYLSPTAFGVGQTAPRTHEFYPPYNRLSNYREPGKININTIFDEGETWKAIVGYVGANEAPGVPTWNEVLRSRAGAAGVSPHSDAQLPSALDMPTRFGNPFRSAMGTNYVPVESLKRTTAGQPRDPIDTTLLRSLYPTNYSGAQTQPLLQYNRASAFGTPPPDRNAPVDTRANPNFRNLLLQKLGNMVTTRSNVYAIWVTVGYFEVDRVKPGQAPSGEQFDSNGHLRYPDGYRLKREVGVDNGQIERHRAFYLIDRTIPVAFERGETHNVENCILLRRFIE